MAVFGYRSLRAIAIACVVAAASFIAAIPARAVGWIRERLVGLVDARPFRALFETPALVLDGPSRSSISPSLWHRNRHEAGLARLGAVRHI